MIVGALGPLKALVANSNTPEINPILAEIQYQ
jgi:hypothetical protein